MGAAAKRGSDAATRSAKAAWSISMRPSHSVATSASLTTVHVEPSPKSAATDRAVEKIRGIGDPRSRAACWRMVGPSFQPRPRARKTSNARLSSLAVPSSQIRPGASSTGRPFVPTTSAMCFPNAVTSTSQRRRHAGSSVINPPHPSWRHTNAATIFPVRRSSLSSGSTRQPSSQPSYQIDFARLVSRNRPDSRNRLRVPAGQRAASSVRKMGPWGSSTRSIKSSSGSRTGDTPLPEAFLGDLVVRIIP